MFNSKRGVSPLVATLLLVGFAVALGGIVMSWGQDLVEEGASGNANCVDINIKLNSLQGTPVKSCFSGSGAAGYVDFIIENDAPFSVEGLSVWIFGQRFDKSNIVKVTEIDDLFIKSGEPYAGHVLYDFTRFGAIDKLQIVPKVSPGSDIIPCYDQSVIVENIGKC